MQRDWSGMFICQRIAMNPDERDFLCEMRGNVLDAKSYAESARKWSMWSTYLLIAFYSIAIGIYTVTVAGK